VTGVGFHFLEINLTCEASSCWWHTWLRSSYSSGIRPPLCGPWGNQFIMCSPPRGE